MLPLNFFEKIFSFEGARPKKGLKIRPFSKISKTKIFIFEYFSKIPSDMNSNDPFYPILIPNTPYVKFAIFLLFRCRGVPGGPKNLKIFFIISKTYFN